METLIPDSWRPRPIDTHLAMMLREPVKVHQLANVAGVPELVVVCGGTALRIEIDAAEPREAQAVISRLICGLLEWWRATADAPRSAAFESMGDDLDD
jgi:hypothetical protein